MAGTIKQRIALEGGKEIRDELLELGRVGEIVWRKLQKGAQDFKGPDTSVSARLKEIAREAEKLGKAFDKVGQQIKDVGKGFSTWVTVPIAGAGAGVLKVAGDFESAMNSLRVATQASNEEFAKLAETARRIGKDSVFGPQEVAQAMEELAKTGVETTDILNGAADATVKLAAANGAELAPAAKLVSDVMNQFHKSASDVPGLVNKITGAVNASKMDFADYQLAIGQAGAVAAGLGVSFDDLNTALAATSSAFSSGSDAGTSFKTFLQRLSPTSKEAAEMIRDMGINFFEAGGKMKPLAQIAEQLRQKLRGLSDEDRAKKLSTIFGTDAMRTAIALMDQGAEGFERFRAAADRFDADAAAETRMKGLEGQMRKLRNALRDLAISIGESGLLKWATDLVKGFTSFIEKLNEASPATLRFATIVGAIVAAIGPVLVVLGNLVLGLGALAKGWGWAAEAAAKFVAQMPKTAQAAGGIAGILRRLVSPFGLVATMILSHLPEIADAAKQIYNALFGDPSKVTDDWIKQLGAALLQVKAAWDKFIKGDWSGAWADLKQGWADAWNAMVALAEKDLSLLVTIAVAAAFGIKKAFGGIGLVLGRQVTKGAQDAGKAISGLDGAAAAARGGAGFVGLLGWAGLFVAGFQIAYEVWPEFRQAADTAFENIKRDFADLKRVIQDAKGGDWGKLWDGFVEEGKNRLETTKDEAKALVKGVADAITGGVPDAVAAMDDLGKRLDEESIDWLQTTTKRIQDNNPAKATADAIRSAMPAAEQALAQSTAKMRADLLRFNALKVDFPWLKGLDDIIRQNLDKAATEAKAGAEKVKSAIEGGTASVRIFRDGKLAETVAVPMEQAAARTKQALEDAAQTGEKVIRVWRGVSDAARQAAAEQAKAGKDGKDAAAAAEAAVKKLGAGWSDATVQSEGAFKDLPAQAADQAQKAAENIKRALSGDDLVEIDFGDGFFLTMTRAEAMLQGLKDKIREIKMEAAKPLPDLLTGSASTDQLKGGAGGDTLGDPLAATEQQLTDAIARLRSLMDEARSTIETGLANVSPAEIDWSVLFTSVEDAIGQVRAAFEGLAQEIPGIVGGIQIDWTGLLAGLQESITQIVTAIQSIAVEAGNSANGVATAANQMVASFQAVEQAARAAAQAAASVSTSGGGDSASGFASGGYIRGPGTGTSDSIPAWLSNGEFVVRAAAVRKYGRQLLAALNAGRLSLPAFAQGGIVSAPQLKLGLPAFSTGGLVAGLSNAMAGLMPVPMMPAPALAGGGGNLRPVHLSIGGETVPVQASEPAVQQLMRLATHKKMTSGSAKPSWLR